MNLQQDNFLEQIWIALCQGMYLWC